MRSGIFFSVLLFGCGSTESPPPEPEVVVAAPSPLNVQTKPQGRRAVSQP